MLDYSAEAAHYDRTRGGEPRAEAAAAALNTLLPASGLILDIGAGTGIVTAKLHRPGRRVLAIDRAKGMLARAARRLPSGSAVLADATALPIKAGSADAIVMVWLLHLLRPAVVDAIVDEAVRVLKPGGSLITTVNKNAAAFEQPSDVAELLGPYARAHRHSDSPVRLEARLTRTGTAHFPGVGQGRSPRAWSEGLSAGHLAGWVPPADRDRLIHALTALPNPDTPRPDPIYPLLRLTRS